MNGFLALLENKSQYEIAIKMVIAINTEQSGTPFVP